MTHPSLSMKNSGNINLLVAMALETLLTVHRACCRVPEHINAEIEFHLMLAVENFEPATLPDTSTAGQSCEFYLQMYALSYMWYEVATQKHH